SLSGVEAFEYTPTYGVRRWAECGAAAADRQAVESLGVIVYGSARPALKESYADRSDRHSSPRRPRPDRRGVAAEVRGRCPWHRRWWRRRRWLHEQPRHVQCAHTGDRHIGGGIFRDEP